jgi:hypothetical protein
MRGPPCHHVGRQPLLTWLNMTSPTPRATFSSAVVIPCELPTSQRFGVAARDPQRRGRASDHHRRVLGILMERLDIDDQRAFAYLCCCYQARNERLYDLAVQLAETSRTAARPCRTGRVTAFRSERCLQEDPVEDGGAPLRESCADGLPQRGATNPKGRSRFRASPRSRLFAGESMSVDLGLMASFCVIRAPGRGKGDSGWGRSGCHRLAKAES